MRTKEQGIGRRRTSSLIFLVALPSLVVGVALRACALRFLLESIGAQTQWTLKETIAVQYSAGSDITTTGR